MLARLVEKGPVTRDTRLPVHFFSAALGREAYAGLQLESLTRQLTDGSIAPLLTHLLTANKLTREEIARLRKLLDSGAAAEGADEDSEREQQSSDCRYSRPQCFLAPPLAGQRVQGPWRRP